MKLITRRCSICSVEFTAPANHGRQRARCDLHWWHAHHPKIPRRKVTEVASLELVPVTGIAIMRCCLCCGGVFLARLEAALYCGLYCFVRDRKTPPVPVSQTVNLRPHTRAREPALAR